MAHVPLRSPLTRATWPACLVVLFWLGTACAQAPAAGAADQRDALRAHVDYSISRAAAYLKAQQRPDGSWGGNEFHSNENGQTALVALALLAAGESHQSPVMKKAIDFLKKQEFQGTYAVALRAAVYSQIPESVRKTHLRGDLHSFRTLITGMIQTGPMRGLYGYLPHKPGLEMGDLSNSQYGVLGVWYAADAGIEVPQSYWMRVEQAWLASQNDDGGFGYRPGDKDSYASMTAAGVATLYVTQDNLRTGRTINTTRARPAEALAKAVTWIDQHFLVDANSGRDVSLLAALEANTDPDNRRRLDGFRDGTWVHYMLFGFERVGEASGLTRFGPHRWFDLGARFLVATQAPDGSWNGSGGRIVDTSYGLLFLARGGAPVVVQKLQFDGRWNNRTRDTSALVRWCRRQFERHVNWQVLPVGAADWEYREAPILYIASNEAPALDDEAVARIKQFIDEGGLLFAAAEGSGDAFEQGITALAARMYPQYAFRDLPADHSVYTANFPADPQKTPMRGLSNGVRELILLSPSGDLPWEWYANGGLNNPRDPHFGLFANTLLYVSGRGGFRLRGQHWATQIDSRLPPPTIQMRVARVKFAANWNPEPAGWDQLAARLHNARVASLDTDVVPLSAPTGDDNPNGAWAPSGALGRDYTLAHMTATAGFALSDAERDELKRYLDAGGTLLFDAAGGDFAAAASFEREMRRLYPDSRFEPLRRDHPAYTGPDGQPMRLVAYRTAALDRAGSRLAEPMLKGLSVHGRLVAILSTEDLSGGLVGYPHDDVIGYAPDVAQRMVSNILLWAAD